MVRELLNFKVKIDLRTAHDSYEAWRDRTHDDLVFATALAAWWGERWRPWMCRRATASELLMVHDPTG
jgi:hypothetical protein